MNPIFIPKSFEETNNDGERTFYCNRLIQGKDIRVIEYYDKKGLLYRVNVWGICGKLEEIGDCLVAWDTNIDLKTIKELRKPIEAMYPEQTKVMFY